ncbi:DNA ligase 1 isoform X4 [Apis florea]|uniref:DNA ligase 1 isoform X4 n=1 Tax=Apis florea TaxID=7463 RepID=UPI0012FE9659|nr:DNA ligase 1 isoform X4 [Apis florea]
MKFVCSIYILFVIFAENKEKFFVQCIANIKENELMYLSNLLNPVECLQLVQAIYEVTPMKTERRVKKYETLMNKDITGMSTLSKECLLNLEEWSQDFPTNAKPNGRTTMEMILRWLGRPDLAKHMWQPKEDKDTFTDYLEWKDEVICSCTDMEDYCTGQCSICKENDYKHHVIDRRSSSSDDSVKELNFVVRKPKKKEKKRKRFTFFQNSCQNKKKEKEQEYRDRKKILENMIMKKHEQQKLLPMLPNDVCCKCCKCTVYIRDKILREKKAREKKARKKKEEKRRKKEKLRKAELRANNVCFRETCK